GGIAQPDRMPRGRTETAEHPHQLPGAGFGSDRDARTGFPGVSIACLSSGNGIVYCGFRPKWSSLLQWKGFAGCGYGTLSTACLLPPVPVQDRFYPQHLFTQGEKSAAVFFPANGFALGFGDVGKPFGFLTQGLFQAFLPRSVPVE